MGILETLRLKSTPNLNNYSYISSDKPNTSDRHLLSLAEAFQLDKKGIKKAKQQGSLSRRISFDKLEQSFLLDELSFRCTNFYALQVSGPTFDLMGNKKGIAVIQNFIDKSHLHAKTEEMVRDMCIFGNSFWEEIKSSKGNIVDIQRIDVKKMDFERAENGVIKEDESGKPIGYVYKREFGEPIKFSSDDILHFKLFGMGNDLGLGFIEPLYKLIYLKLNIRSGFAQAGYRMGHPLNVIYVGDKPDRSSGYQGHPPTKNLVDAIDTEWQDIEAKHKFIMPYFTRVEQLNPITVENQRNLLDYVDSRIAGAFGIPLELVAGEGRGNRATLEISVTRDLDRTIKAIQNRIAMRLELDIFPQILAQNGMNPDEISVKIRWKEITPADLNRMATRLQKYVDVGILTPEDVRETVLKAENLPIPTEKQKEIQRKGTEFLDINEAIGRRHITVEEAIMFLKNLRMSFPQDTIAKVCDELIEKIKLKSNMPEIPTESGTPDKKDEEE